MNRPGGDRRPSGDGQNRFGRAGGTGRGSDDRRGGNGSWSRDANRGSGPSRRSESDERSWDSGRAGAPARRPASGERSGGSGRGGASDRRGGSGEWSRDGSRAAGGANGSRPRPSGRGGEGSGRSFERSGAPRGSSRSFDNARPARNDRFDQRGDNRDRPEQPRFRGPALPKDLDLRQLPRGVRAELRSLSPEKAETVGGHLLMAGRLIDDDPRAANAHALAAKQAAPRLPIVREAVGETAYAAGDFAEALSEFRALRRMSGTDEYLPAMADCERALGRHQAALKLVREGLAGAPEAAAEIELRLVEAGVRADAGQRDEALRLLQSEIENIGSRGPKVARARLRYAYADLLEANGDIDGAERWFIAASGLDPEETTDAADRVARLSGLVIEYDDTDEVPDEPIDESGTVED